MCVCVLFAVVRTTYHSAMSCFRMQNQPETNLADGRFLWFVLAEGKGGDNWAPLFPSWIEKLEEGIRKGGLSATEPNWVQHIWSSPKGQPRNTWYTLDVNAMTQTNDDSKKVRHMLRTHEGGETPRRKEDAPYAAYV